MIFVFEAVLSLICRNTAFIVIRKKYIDNDDQLKNYIFELYAHPSGQGFGTELLKEMQYNRQYIYLHVKKTNLVAIKFYENNDFHIKEREGTKHRMEWKSKSVE